MRGIGVGVKSQPRIECTYLFCVAVTVRIRIDTAEDCASSNTLPKSRVPDSYEKCKATLAFHGNKNIFIP